MGIAETISASSDFRTLLASAFCGGDLHPTGGTQLKLIVAGAVACSLNSPTASMILTAVSENEIYPELANLLSKELYTIGSTKPDPDERLLLNYSILIYHLHRWKVPLPQLRELVLSLDQGIQGIRGKLISIQSRHPHLAESDQFLPPNTNHEISSIAPTIRAQSSFLEAIDQESKAIAAGNGLFHRQLDTKRQVDPAFLTGAPHQTQELTEAWRDIFYTQFEHTGLIFMALPAMEFLLRSCCPVEFPPDHPLEAVIKSHTRLSDSLREQIMMIFSPNKLNIRNRCMHGSFLEIEGRRDDLIRASGLLEQFGVVTADLSDDGSLPEPVSKLTLATLHALSAELESIAAPFNTTWTEHFLLTEDEKKYASHIHYDFINPEAAETWRKQIGVYIDSAAPCLATPIKMGMVCWLKNNLELAAVPGFFYLALLFEPLLRLTLHLGGKPVLQTAVSNKNNKEHFRLQYSMIDGRGLISKDNLDWLTNHIPDAEKPNALEMLRLATKCRDAFAHGAIHNIDSDLLLVYGHTLTKAIQLLTEVGLKIIDAQHYRVSISR